MSDVVGTGTAAFSRGEDRPRGVSITAVGVPTAAALESPDTQPEALLGSRTAHRAGHRRVSGRHQHHPPARPHTTLDKFSFTRPDRRIGRFTSHPGLGQEPGFEILDRDQRVMVGDPFGPDAGVVGVLPGRFLGEPGGLPLRVEVALRRRVAPPPADQGRPGSAPAVVNRSPPTPVMVP